MLQFVDEAESIVTNPGRPLDEFGRLLHEGWQIKRSLTQKITNPQIDEIYEAGLSAGALGGKLLGAGGGGFMLFYRAAREAAGAAGAFEEAAVRSVQLLEQRESCRGVRARGAIRQIAGQRAGRRVCLACPMRSSCVAAPASGCGV